MLTQEKRLGYKNKAVMGGIENLAPNWAAEARQEATREEEYRIIEEVLEELRRYPDIAREERPNYVHEILVKLYRANESAKSRGTVTRKRPARRDAGPRSEENQSDQAMAQSAPPPEQNVTDDSAPPSPGKQERSRSRTVTTRSNRTPQGSTTGKRQSQSEVDWANTGLDSPVTRLPGIKEAMAKRLARLGVETVGDFLTLYPRRYDDYRSLKPINQLQYGEDVTIIAHIWETRKAQSRNNVTMVKSVLSDGTANIEVTWFNQPWLVNKLRPGKQVVISGKVDQYLGRLTFNSPEWEELEAEMTHTGRLVPVYPLTQGITAKWLRSYIKQTVDYWAERLPDYLSDEARKRLNLLKLSEAVRQIHFPDNQADLEAARRRLAFDELLMIQLGVLRQRQAWKKQQGQPITIQLDVQAKLLTALPFQLTQAQQKVLNGIVVDLQRDTPMSRLLQGDVGSGKTVVALAVMVLTALDNGQSAILAPTEILAEQHFKGMSQLLVSIGQALGRQFEIRLLTGSTPASDRQEILAGLANGAVNILVGTHAIIQENVEIQDLRLAVIDEQHRFGVEQRSALRQKGFNPHMLVMTATPIPRTLALTLYGDLDLSVIDEMPPGRQPIRTKWLTPRERERAYSFIQSQIEKGRQAFIICPLVEETENTEAKAAVEEHERLSKAIFPNLKVGLLHGRMKAQEKEETMRQFRDRETHLLVSTSVVEVGIDVPNASVMLVEGANRFGLAQLHQFRGRVGRGEHQSYCLLLADKITEEAKQRLQAMEQTLNGFELAEQDLKMRGPGEFFGTRQSGLPDLKLVKLSDTRLLELAREEALQIFEKDPNLEQPHHRQLAKQVTEFWKEKTDLS